MCVYIYIYTHIIHICVRTYKHTYVLTYLHTCIHACIDIYIHTYIPYIHTYTHARTYVHTHTHTCIQITHIHTHISPCTHTCSQATCILQGATVKLELAASDLDRNCEPTNKGLYCMSISNNGKYIAAGCECCDDHSRSSHCECCDDHSRTSHCECCDDHSRTSHCECCDDHSRTSHVCVMTTLAVPTLLSGIRRRVKRFVGSNRVTHAWYHAWISVRMTPCLSPGTIAERSASGI